MKNGRKFNSAEEALNRLLHAYGNERNVEEMLSCVTEDVKWIGTEGSHCAIGKVELRKIVEAEVELYPFSLDIDLNILSIQNLGDSASIITVTGSQISDISDIRSMRLRGTVCCVKSDDGWLISNIHASVPNAEKEKIILQDELDSEREKKLAIIDNMPGGITTFRLKKDGHVYTEYISDGLARLCGFNTGDEYMDAITDDNKKYVVEGEFVRIEEACKMIARIGGTGSVKYSVYDKAGKIIRLSLDFVAIKNVHLQEDDIAAFYGVQTLVSEDDICAKTEQDYYRKILNFTGTTFFEIDEDKNFYASDRFSKYKASEYGSSAIMGDIHSKYCFHPDDLPKLTANLHKVGKTGEGAPVVCRMLMKDGTYQWTELTAHLEFTDDHKVKRMTGILRNVNPEWEKQKKELEEALSSAKSANTEKTEFLSRVSHDMRTPMNGILGLASLSEDEEDLSVIKENVNKIKQSGEYLLGLINDTLDFQKIESGRLGLEPEIVSTKNLISNVLMMTKIAAEKKNIDVKMISENANLDGLVNVDPMRMKQIFFNLLSNAVKFTQPGGSIEIRFECVGHTGNMAHDVITIIDTGIGMSKDFLDNHIFQPFSQEHSDIVSNYGGSGLGLSIVKKLVELMNGEIKVESKLGEGTKFTVYIDFQCVDEVENKKNNQIAKMGRDSITKAIEGKHILLAEDHPLNAEIAVRLLNKVGCNVVVAKDGKECVDEFEASAENEYDAILMDIRMPVMDGIEATKEIRRQSRQDAKTIPIIAMTANAYDKDVKQCIESGMNNHIAKPLDVMKMYETIAKSIG